MTLTESPQKLTVNYIKHLTLPERPESPQKDHSVAYEYVKTLKAFVADLEERNYSFLILYRSDGKWWQLIGHSVLYYRYIYASRIGRDTPNIRFDHDYYSKSATGITSISDISALVKAFKQLGLRIELKKKDVVIIRLDKNFTKDEIATFAQIEDNKNHEIHHLLQPKVVCPDFFNRTKELHIAIADSVRRSKSPFRDKYGARGFDLSWRLLNGCVSMSNGQISRSEYFQGAEKTLELLRSWLSAVHAIRVDTYTNDTVLRIAQQIKELQQQAVAELKNDYHKKRKKV